MKRNHIAVLLASLSLLGAMGIASAAGADSSTDCSGSAGPGGVETQCETKATAKLDAPTTIVELETTVAVPEDTLVPVQGECSASSGVAATCVVEVGAAVG